MDSSFNSSEWQGVPIASDSDATGMLDWVSLRSRLFAGRATLHALESDLASVALRSVGSFDCSSARALSQIGHGSGRINQSRIGDGNATSDIPVRVAGTPMTGVRG